MTSKLKPADINLINADWLEQLANKGVGLVEALAVGGSLCAAILNALDDDEVFTMFMATMCEVTGRVATVECIMAGSDKVN